MRGSVAACLGVSPSRAGIESLMQTLAKTDLLILDDWGLAPLGDRERRDLLALVEERAGRRATLVTSQLPIEHGHEMIGDATFGTLSSTGWCTMPTGSPSPAARSADSLPHRSYPQHTPTHRSRDPSSSDDRHGAKRVIALDRNR